MLHNRVDEKYIEIIYQDESIVVVNKQSGILVIPDQHTSKNKTLVGLLERRLNQRIWLVHVMDRDVTGVMVFAKNSEARKNISMQFENLKICKKYIALVSGVLEEDNGIINKPILVSGDNVSINPTGKESITNFKVLERFISYTLVQISPLTNMRYQMRVHLWSLGHPLAIDGKFGVFCPIFLSTLKHNYKVKKRKIEKPLISRLTLHSSALTLMSCGKMEEKTFKATMPKDFEVTLKQLRKYYKSFHNFHISRNVTT